MVGRWKIEDGKWKVELAMDNNGKIKNQKSRPKADQPMAEKIKSDEREKELDGKGIEEELKRRVEEIEGNYKRVLADYQNLEKRVVEERGEWIRNANKELLLRLLPVLDTLMLAAKHSKDEGIKLSVQQFLDTLKLEGVEKIETKDKQFDPHIMECVDTKEGEDGKVIEEARVGYKLFDETLRVAGVIVGKP